MKALPLLLLLLLLAIGCGPGDDRVVGKWVGHLELSQEDIARGPALPADQREKTIRDAESRALNLDVRKDGTYTLEIEGNVVSDEWVIQGDILVLASYGTNPGVKGGDAVPNEIPMHIKIEDDGTLSFLDEQGEMSSKVIFKRQ